MRKLLLIFIVLFSALPVLAQYPARRFQPRASDPATCNEADTYWNTTSHKQRVCTATNTWADFGSGASVGTVTGTGASGRLPLWSSASALGSDASATYSGSTTTLEFQIPALRLNKSIGAVSTDSLILENTTAATVGAQKWSPRLRFTGRGWKTDATAGSQVVDWIVENQPVQGTASPSTNLVFSSQVNGGGYTPRMTLDNSGALTVTSCTGCGGAVTGEQLLATVPSVNLNSAGTSTNLYTVPVGKTLVVTRIVVRNASAAVSTANLKFEFAADTENVASVTSALASLDNPAKYYTHLPGIYDLYGAVATIGVAGEILKARNSVAEGSALTVTIDVFGYLF